MRKVSAVRSEESALQRHAYRITILMPPGHHQNRWLALCSEAGRWGWQRI